VEFRCDGTVKITLVNFVAVTCLPWYCTFVV